RAGAAGQRVPSARRLTRKPESERAAALVRHGVDVVKGDLDDEATLRRALAGAWGGFGVQNAAEAGVQREEEQGKRLATLAREAGVEHYVYTSVGSAHKRTGVPHFDNKRRIEETVRDLRFPSHVILRPVFFMENLLAPFSLQGSTLAWALGPGTKLQMIAEGNVLDIPGWTGSFTEDGVFNNISGEESYRGEHLKDIVITFAKMFPDVHRELHRVNVMGDVVAIELSIQGTFRGPMETPAGVIQPSGAKVNIPCADFFYMRNGKIERFDCYPALNIMLKRMAVPPDF